jgi:YNFM family putative membrane transporter
MQIGADRRFWLVNAALLAAGFATFAALYDVQPLLPVFSQQFGVPPATASLALSVSTFALAFALLGVGPLADRWGRKRPMVVSMAAGAVLTLACAAAPNFGTVVAVRLLEGIALSGLPGVAMAYLSEEIPPLQLGFAMGLYIAGSAVGGMAGRLLVGVLTDIAGWRLALCAIAVLSLIGAALVGLLLPDSLNFTPNRQTLAQARAAYFAHVSDAGLPWLYVVGFLAMGAFVTVYNYLGYRLEAAPFMLSQSQIGLVFIVYLAGIVASPVMGRLADRFTRRNVMWISAVVMLSGAVMTLGHSLAFVIAGMAVYTWGFFGVHSLASSWVGRRAREHRSHASALYLFAYYLGSGVVGSLGGVVFALGGWRAVIALVAVIVAGLLTISLTALRRLAPIGVPVVSP